MEIQSWEILSTWEKTPYIQVHLRPADERDLRLRQENIQDLKTVQRIFLEEEDKALSLDEVLSRILSFYRRFVPYK